MRFLLALFDLAARALEFSSWREDWNRTWSPVSFWIAVITGLVALVVAALYAHAAWRFVRSLFATAA